MNRILLMAWILAGACPILCGQTNASSAAVQCCLSHSLNTLSPAAHPDTGSESSLLRLQGDGQWENAANAYSREAEFHSPGLRAPPKGHLPSPEAQELKPAGSPRRLRGQSSEVGISGFALMVLGPDDP